MRRRRAIGVFLAISLIATAAATTASAATKPKPKPKPKCNMLLDDRLDDGNVSFAPGQKSKALDIISGDVATGPTQMVAVLRVKSTAISPTTEPYAALGFNWTIATTSSLGQSYAFKVRRSESGISHPTVTVDSVAVPSNLYTFKIVGTTYVWTMKRSASPNLARPKNVFRQFRATSQVFSTNGDDALTSASFYPDRALSCVVAR